MQKKEDCLEEIFKYFIERKIPINRNKFADVIKSHPQFPQLISISYALDFFKIDYRIVECSLKKAKGISKTFLAYFEVGGDNMNLFHVRCNEGFCEVNSTKVTDAYTERHWGQKIIVFDSNEKLIVTRNREMLLLFVGVLLLFSFLVVVFLLNYEALSFYIFPITGLILSIFALKDVLGIDTIVTDKICRTTKKTDCSTIINSKKWKLFKIVDFSDLSFTYFVFQILTLSLVLLLNEKSSYFQIQFTSIILSAPLLLISIYYQKFIERKWCIICLSIITVLVFELFYMWVYLKSYINFDRFNLGLIIVILSTFLAVILIWKMIKKLIIKNKIIKTEVTNRDQHLLKYSVFKSVLTLGKYHNVETDYINLKDHAKGKNITLITDPFCDFCKDLHFKLDALVTETNNYIQYNVVFNINLAEESDIVASVYRGLMHLQTTNEHEFRRALDKWFDIEDEKSWIDDHATEFYSKRTDVILNSQYQWCNNYHIRFTPALFINGYLLPNIYTVEDLILILPEVLKDPHW